MAKKRMQMAQKSWKIEEIFPRFVNAQMAKGVSDKTVLTYNRHFHSLGYHLDMTMTFDELTKEALDSMLVSLRKSGVSPNTISSYARVFRTFLKWCRAEGYTDLSLPNIQDKETVKGSYTDEELIALLRKPAKDCDFCEYRNWVIVNFLINSGCRAGTIRNIQNRDVSLSDKRVIYRHTKTGKLQSVPLCSQMAKILSEYMGIRGGAPEDYLFCSKSARTKRKPIEEILTDTLVSPEMRKKAEKAIYRSYIATDGVHVKTTRQTLAKHFVKTRCKSLTKYDDFVREYNLWLDGLGLGDNSSLTIESRGYENILNQCDYVLWNQWRSFRYYNIVDQDFGELLSTIDFDQFQNTEISSLKLFRDYKELMQQYDIHDEYELHNLLKKIWSNENGQVAFRKMPTIEVGIPDRDEQVLSLLLQYAPISAENLSTKYEEAYGIKAASVLANYLGCLDVYYFDGVYSITSDNLPPIQFERMKDVLTDVFYTISDVKRLFLREFPDADTSSINPYTLKTLGFRVYSGYVVKNTYPSAVDYFRELLTTEDVVNAKALSRSVLNVVAYSSELYRLRSNYEIVEYAPLQYINIRRLNAAGITVLRCCVPLSLCLNYIILFCGSVVFG